MKLFLLEIWDLQTVGVACADYCGVYSSHELATRAFDHFFDRLGGYKSASNRERWRYAITELELDNPPAPGTPH